MPHDTITVTFVYGGDGGEPGRLPESPGGRRAGSEGDVDRDAEDGRPGVGLASPCGARRRCAAPGRSRRAVERRGESPIAAREPATRSAELRVTMRVAPLAGILRPFKPMSTHPAVDEPVLGAR
jgi:hypothetical protein